MDLLRRWYWINAELFAMQVSGTSGPPQPAVEWILKTPDEERD